MVRSKLIHFTQYHRTYVSVNWKSVRQYSHLGGVDLSFIPSADICRWIVTTLSMYVGVLRALCGIKTLMSTFSLGLQTTSLINSFPAQQGKVLDFSPTIPNLVHNTCRPHFPRGILRGKSLTLPGSISSSAPSSSLLPVFTGLTAALSVAGRASSKHIGTVLSRALSLFISAKAHTVRRKTTRAASALPSGTPFDVRRHSGRDGRCQCIPCEEGYTEQGWFPRHWGGWAGRARY